MMLTRQKNILFIITACVVFLDQLTKRIVLRFLGNGHVIWIVPDRFRFSLVENTGVAFGIFRNYPDVLTAVISVCILFLFGYAFFSSECRLLPQTAYGLILGGAFGNWLDRFRLGYVVDFLDFRIWPVFNVADSCITIGIIFFIMTAVFGKKAGKQT